MLILNIDACLKFKIVFFSVYIFVALVLYMKCVTIQWSIIILGVNIIDNSNSSNNKNKGSYNFRDSVGKHKLIKTLTHCGDTFCKKVIKIIVILIRNGQKRFIGFSSVTVKEAAQGTL